jgi:flagellar hook-length control protein FliK
VTADPTKDGDKTGDKKAAVIPEAVALNGPATPADPAQAANTAAAPVAIAAVVPQAATDQVAVPAELVKTGKSAKVGLSAMVDGKAGASVSEPGRPLVKDATPSATPAPATATKTSDNQTPANSNDAGAAVDFSAMTKEATATAPAAAANLVQSLAPAAKAAVSQAGTSESAPIAGASSKAAADTGTANLANAAPAQAASDTPKASATSQTQAAPRVPVPELGTYVARMAKTGENNFDLRLDPLDLGRVDVKVEITESGKINATFLVERKETLEMLQKDSSQLQQAFENAGLKADSNSLSFSLKDQSNSGNQGNPKAFRSFSQYDLNPDSTQAANDAAIPVRTTTALRALDISI